MKLWLRQIVSPTNLYTPRKDPLMMLFLSFLTIEVAAVVFTRVVVRPSKRDLSTVFLTIMIVLFCVGFALALYQRGQYDGPLYGTGILLICFAMLNAAPWWFFHSAARQQEQIEQFRSRQELYRRDYEDSLDV